jgi:exosome complex RNA-binding protein Csl4
MNTVTITSEMIEAAGNDFLDFGAIVCFCPRCQDEMTIEPDADSGYCESCGRVVKVINPLIYAGLI